MNVALDTNILLYAEGVDGPQRSAAIWAVLRRCAPAATALPMQACAEFFRALVIKFRWDRERALAAAQTWQSAAQLVPLSENGFNDALSLATIHRIQVFDAMILASAVEADCDVLLSEDMQHGFAWRGCTVVNPFQSSMHPALAALLRP